MLKLIPFPSGSCTTSLLSLYYTLLRRLSGGKKKNICLVKALRFCPGNLGDLECASSNLSESEAQRLGFALLFHRGVDAPSTEICSSGLLWWKTPA